MAGIGLRLAVRLSSVKRVFNQQLLVDHLLTENGLQLVHQDGRPILGENTQFATGPRFIEESLSGILTQSGNFINTQADQILAAQALLSLEETGQNYLLAEDNRILLSQDGLLIIADQSSLVGQTLPADGLLTQAGTSLFTQGGKQLLTDQSEFTGLNIEGDILLTQNGDILTAENNDYLNQQSSQYV